MSKKKPKFLTHDAIHQILLAHAQYIDSGGKEGAWADLSLCVIEDFDFSGLDFQDTHLQNSSLIRCRFVSTNLSGAVLDETHAPGTDFRDANLVKSEVFETDLRGACFDGANLTRGFYLESDLRGATFRGADLFGATFSKCDLREALFDGADLEGAFFKDCRVEGASWVDVKHLTPLSVATLTLGKRIEARPPHEFGDSDD